jgi:GNAT superfamily N-acetyltransferase
MAGVFYVRDFKQPFPDDFSLDNCPSLVPAVNCLHRVDEIYNSMKPALQVGECVDLLLLGVHPLFQRRGVARLLTEAAVQHMRTTKFKFVVLESSGEFSAKCAQAVGMQQMASIRYADYEPVLVGEHHSCMRFWELEL